MWFFTHGLHHVLVLLHFILCLCCSLICVLILHFFICFAHVLHGYGLCLYLGSKSSPCLFFFLLMFLFFSIFSFLLLFLVRFFFAAVPVFLLISFLLIVACSCWFLFVPAYFLLLMCSVRAYLLLLLPASGTVFTLCVCVCVCVCVIAGTTKIALCFCRQILSRDSITAVQDTVMTLHMCAVVISIKVKFAVGCGHTESTIFRGSGG